MSTPFPLKRLTVSFDAPIAPRQISAFRGAVVKLVGREDSLLFHNHLSDKRFRYSYPLIQYKCLHHKPSIVCIGDGVGEIHKFFQQENWEVNVAGQQMRLRVAKLEMKELHLQTQEQLNTYRIRYWAAISDKILEEFQQLEGMTARIQKLEQVLAGNIISMAKGIGWQVPERVNCTITEMGKEFFIPIKGIKKRVFNLTFKTNVFLPNDIGLGRHTSLGFGTIWQVR